MPDEQKDNVSYAGQLLSASEVADILKIGGVTVRRWIHNGLIPAIALPHKGERAQYRIKGETVDNILSGGKTIE